MPFVMNEIGTYTRHSHRVKNRMQRPLSAQLLSTDACIDELVPEPLNQSSGRIKGGTGAPDGSLCLRLGASEPGFWGQGPSRDAKKLAWLCWPETMALVPTGLRSRRSRLVRGRRSVRQWSAQPTQPPIPPLGICACETWHSKDAVTGCKRNLAALTSPFTRIWFFILHERRLTHHVQLIVFTAVVPS
jgi:hypothetical protein